MAGFDNETCYFENIDPRGVVPVEPQVTASGQIPIGTGGSPAIKIGKITSSTLTVGYSDPDITIEAGSGLVTDVETANATPQFVPAGSTTTVDFGITNLALGSSLPNLTVGTTNVAFGDDALESVTQGSGNTAIGYEAADSITTGSNNVAVGKQSLVTATSTVQNTAVGTSALAFLTTSTGSNTAIGYASLDSITTGTSNTALGEGAGGTLTSSDSSNICIKHAGVSGDNNTIRIGSPGSGAGQQDKAFMAGITGVTVAGSAPMGINANGQMSSLGFGVANQVFTSNGPATSPTWQDPASAMMPWTEVTGTSQAAVVNNAYVPSNVATVTVNLPATFAFGDIVRIGGKGSGGWSLVANTGDTIHFGDQDTSAGGSLSSTQRYDTVTVVGITANSEWLVIQSSGNLTVA